MKGNEVKYGFAIMSAALLLSSGIIEGFWMVIVLYVALSLIIFLSGKAKAE